MSKTVRVEIPTRAKERLLEGETIVFQIPPQSDVTTIEITLKKSNIFGLMDKVFAELDEFLSFRKPKK